jgi:hypothetical protein
MNLSELQTKYPDKKFGEVNVRRSWDFIEIKLQYLPVEEGVDDLGWRIYLDHSCDVWEIGGVKEAEEMIKNLQDAVQYCKDNP